jgi:hypothetical protein
MWRQCVNRLGNIDPCQNERNPLRLRNKHEQQRGYSRCRSWPYRSKQKPKATQKFRPSKRWGLGSRPNYTGNQTVMSSRLSPLSYSPTCIYYAQTRRIGCASNGTAPWNSVGSWPLALRSLSLSIPCVRSPSPLLNTEPHSSSCGRSNAALLSRRETRRSSVVPRPMLDPAGALGIGGSSTPSRRPVV